MTVSSTTTRELDVNTICRRAFQLAGLMDASQGVDSPQWATRSAMARDFLESDIESLQSAGINVRHVDFYDLTLTADTSPHTADASTLDLLGDAMYLPEGETDGWTVVAPRSREEYVTLPHKASSGRPSLYYAHRGATLQIYFWPVPDSDNLGTVRFQRHKLMATATEGGATMDLARHWTEYLLFSLAHKLALANTLPIERCGYLRSESERHFKRAKAYSQQRTPGFMHIDHPTGWRR